MNALLAETALRLVLLIVTEYGKHQQHQREQQKHQRAKDECQTVIH